MVVVADAAVMSASNLGDLDAAGLRFIVGAAPRQGPRGPGLPLLLAQGPLC